MQLQNWLNSTTQALATAEVDSPRLDPLIFLEVALGKERSWLLAHQDEPLSPKQLDKLKHMLTQRLKRVPLAYIVGYKDFYNMRLKVTPDVLIPRPETEALVHEVVQSAPQSARLLDIGTGSGAIAIAIAKNRGDMTVFASDIAESALAIGRQNAQLCQVRVQFALSNLLQNIDEQFDVITANLPYLDATQTQQPELAHEPAAALYASQAGLKLYGDLFADIKRGLLPTGNLLIEHLPAQYAKLVEIAKQQGLTPQQISRFVTKFSW